MKNNYLWQSGHWFSQKGKKVLLIDADPQGDLTASLGFTNPDEINNTLATFMMSTINEVEMETDFAILHHSEGVDVLPSNIDLSAMEILLVNVMSREMILKRYSICFPFYLCNGVSDNNCWHECWCCWYADCII